MKVILNEGLFIEAFMIRYYKISTKKSREIETVDNLFQPLMNHLFNPTTLH